MNKVIIVGAGIAGCFMALSLAKRGYRVEMYEYRPDVRKQPYDSGRSFNLTLYYRGIVAMKKMGIWAEIKKIATIAKGNVAHHTRTKNIYDAFSDKGQEILYTVHRNQLNATLLDIAEKEPNLDITFNAKCTAIDTSSKTLTFQKERTHDVFTVTGDVVIGADGIHSIVREAIQKTLKSPGRLAILSNETWGYKEVHVSSQLAKTMNFRLQATHTWPRPNSLLIAFPNPDESFTLMFNLPLEGEGSFADLISKERIDHYITKNFPDLIPLLPEITHALLSKPTGKFTTIHTARWYSSDFMVLIGDSAHAVIPFYGQGICAAFEDCLLLCELLDKYSGNWAKIFPLYQKARKKNTDILAQLSKDNFIELRDKSRSTFFTFKNKADTFLNRLFPQLWFPPLYVLIAHGSLEYEEALKMHKRQQKIARLIGLDAVLYLMSTPWLLAAYLKKLKIKS